MRKAPTEAILSKISKQKFGDDDKKCYLCLRRKNKSMITDDKKERYINPYTDFGFKRLFGTEMNKDLLISFLNSILGNGDIGIRDIQYLNSERLGVSYGDRKSVFDVYCETENHSKLIVEMQKAEQRFFKDRSIYYAAVPIREQAPKGKWDYHLENVYTVGILDFVFPENEYPEQSYRHEVKLKDVEDNHVFYDKLTFIYLEMPKFTKTEDELETMADKWMFAVRNLSRLLDRPKALQDRVFKKFFEQAEIARYTPEERRDYEESVKIYRDYINTLDTAHDKGYESGRAKGRAEGRAEGLQDVARKMKGMGISLETIIDATGLSREEID